MVMFLKALFNKKKICQSPQNKTQFIKKKFMFICIQETYIQNSLQKGRICITQ